MGALGGSDDARMALAHRYATGTGVVAEAGRAARLYASVAANGATVESGTSVVFVPCVYGCGVYVCMRVCVCCFCCGDGIVMCLPCLCVVVQCAL